MSLLKFWNAKFMQVPQQVMYSLRTFLKGIGIEDVRKGDVFTKYSRAAKHNED